MRQTITEKILSDHSGKRVKAGDFVIAKVDFCFGQDGTSGIIIDCFEKLGKDDVFDKDRFCMVMDHSAPSPTIGVADSQKRMRDFARDHGIKLYDVDCGISHQVIPECGHITCGDLVLGADSHTCTYGALNVLATGVGSTDVAMVLAGGKSWMKAPETMKVVVRGKAPKGVCAKDIMLYIINEIGAEGASSLALEFTGETIDSMSIESRMCIANMSVETGAVCGLMKADRKTLAWANKSAIREP
ncbi:MAG: 3-isopropylmalate dehydratase large subunit, partial [Candidatus Omnitrophica bacterium]|nr:3-isopropylmalate dehydratase large subunit [Candidatus Omnitrophota bacterium]